MRARSAAVVTPLILAAAAAALGQEADGRAALVLRLEPGATFPFRLRETREMQMTQAGGVVPPRKSTSDFERLWTAKVAGTDPSGVAELEIRFGRTHGSAANPMGTIEFDSDAAAPDATTPAAAIQAAFSGPFVAFAGKTATARVGNDGKVLAVEGLDTLAADLAAGNPGLKPMADAYASPAAAKDVVQRAFPKLPDGPVAVGDAWTDTVVTDAATGVKMTLASTYRVTAVEADAVAVAIEGKVTFAVDPEKADPAKAGRAAATAAFFRDADVEQGDVKGTARISRRDGVVLLQETTSTLRVKGREGTPQFGAAMEQSSSIRIERTDPPKADAPAAAPPGAPK